MVRSHPLSQNTIPQEAFLRKAFLASQDAVCPIALFGAETSGKKNLVLSCFPNRTCSLTLGAAILFN